MLFDDLLNEAVQVNNTVDSLLRRVPSQHSDQVSYYKSNFSFPECFAFNLAGAFVHYGYVSREKENFLDSVVRKFSLPHPASYYLELQRLKSGNEYYNYDVKYGHDFDYSNCIWMMLFLFGQSYVHEEVIGNIISPYVMILIRSLNDGNNVSDYEMSYIVKITESFAAALRKIQNNQNIPFETTKRPVPASSSARSSVGTNAPSPSGSNSISSSQELPLKVEKVGGTLGPVDRDNCRTVCVGVDIVNPNKNKMASFITVEVTLSDANGNVVDVINEDIYHIDAGATFHFGYTKVWVNGSVVNISANAYARGFVDTNKTAMDGTSFGNCSLNNDFAANICTVGGLLKSDYNRPIQGCTVHFQIVNASGKIIGGDNVYLDYLPAGQTRSISSDLSLCIQGGSKIIHSIDFDLRQMA